MHVLSKSLVEYVASLGESGNMQKKLWQLGKCGDGNIILKQFPENILHAYELHLACSEKAPNMNIQII